MNKALLYINGFNIRGDGEPRNSERRIFAQFERLGIIAVHAQVNWKSAEPLVVVRRRLTDIALGLLAKTGDLTVAGFSAGGSMSLNIYGGLKDRPVRAISIAGRLSSQDLTADAAAQWGQKPDNRLLFESVKYCEDTTIPNLTGAEKDSITVLTPENDDVVPTECMQVPGVQPIILKTRSHLRASAIGMAMIPELLDRAA